MEVNELLQRYEAGDRDFAEVNLMGASLSRANLEHL